MLFGHPEVRIWDFQGGSVVKNLPANAGDSGDAGLIPGLGRSPGGGNGSLLQYSSQENPMDRGAWQATVHGVTKNWTWLSNRARVHTHTHTHTHTSEYRGLFLKLSFVNLDVVFLDVRSLIYEVYILYISLSIYCRSIIYILHYMPIFYCCIHRYYQGNIFLNYSRLVIYCVTFSRP